MHKKLAESFAAEIERDEIRECTERMNRYRTLAAESHGQEQEQLLRLADAAEAELKQWTALASLVRLSADNLATPANDSIKTGAQEAPRVTN